MLNTIFHKLFNNNKRSLAKQYVLYAIISSAVVVITTAWVSYMTHKAFVEKNDFFLKKEAHELQFILDEKLILLEHLLQFIGTKIRFNYDGTAMSILREIRPHNNNFKDDSFAWGSFEFIDADGELIASSIHTEKNLLVSEKQRPWLTKAKTRYWYINFSNPTIDLLDGSYIIPAGISLYDKIANTIVGYLAVGIDIEKLTSHFISFIEDEVEFIFYNDDKQIISSSDPEIIYDNAIPIDSLPLSPIHNKEAFSEAITIIRLPKPLYIKSTLFSYYVHSKRFPFSILIGQNQEQYYSAIQQAILPQLITYVLLAFLIVTLLSILGQQVIKPIIELGKAADNISRGKKISLSGYNNKEFNILSKQLGIISKINRSLKYKQYRLAFMNEKLGNANEFIKSNVAFLNHELINPISSILGFANILHKKASTINDTEVKDSIDMIYKAAQHQNTQLKFFLKLFKFQESKRKIEEKPINLKQLVLWNLSMIIHHIKNKNIKVITNIPEDLALLGDEIMLGQLIQNLASNAAKYNKFNGQLEITASVNKTGGIEISFIDSGIGIEKKELKNIFKMFSRSANIKDKVIGYGIGLTYAKQCIDLHNAKIEVSSKILEGSTFKVIFPKARTQSLPPKP